MILSAAHWPTAVCRIFRTEYQWYGTIHGLSSCTLTHWGRDKIDAISQTTFSSAFSWNVWIPIKISLKFVPKGPINNIPALVQIMAWRRPGDKPLSEPMMVSLPTHICVTRPQWVNKSVRRSTNTFCTLGRLMEAFGNAWGVNPLKPDDLIIRWTVSSFTLTVVYHLFDA